MHRGISLMYRSISLTPCSEIRIVSCLNLMWIWTKSTSFLGVCFPKHTPRSKYRITSNVIAYLCKQHALRLQLQCHPVPDIIHKLLKFAEFDGT